MLRWNSEEKENRQLFVFQFRHWQQFIQVLSPLPFDFALEYAIRKVQETNLWLDMNDTHQVLACVDDLSYRRWDQNNTKIKRVIKYL